MAVNTVEDFLALLDRSKLLAREQLAEVRALADQAPDAASLAKSLSRQGILSRWQVANLLAGRSVFFVGKYKLIELLGRGGMGRVFLAEHTTMNRRVALKVVPRHVSQDPASLQRFFAEARASASLDHPNFVQAFSVDNECERYFIVMEYVDGPDLERIVEDEGPLDFARAADYIRQAAEGLAFAHARHMIHCDIKPSNLLVNQQGVVKILDMGLARIQGDDETPADQPVESHALGTVDYLSPEQALETSDFDHRADIYSLGCTFYFLLTGHAPFPEGTLPQRILKHQTQEPRSILEERPDTPPQLVAICRKMMAKQPSERYQSAEEVAQTLAAWQPGARTIAPPIPLKKAVPLDEELPENTFAASAWWDSIVSTPTSSDNLPMVKTIPGGNGGKKHDGAKAGGPASGKAAGHHGRPSWLGTPGRKIAAAAAAGIVVLAAAAGIVFSMHSRDSKPLATGNAPQQKSTASSSTIVEPNVPRNVVQAPLEKSKTNPPGDTVKPEKTPRKSEEPKPVKSPEKPSPEKPTPAKPTPEKPKPEPPQPKPEEPKPKPEPKPPEPKPEPIKRPATPLAALAKTVDLPALNGEGGAAETRSLGNVYLPESGSLSLQLITGKTTSRARPKFVLQGAEGRKDRWLVRAETGGSDDDAARNVARLWLEKQALNFQWLPDAAELRGDHLRNCGLMVAVGEESRFLPLRSPKDVEPISLDLDLKADEKPANERSLLDDNLPDKAALRLQLLGLDSPFPAHKVRIVGPRKVETALAANGKLDILFNDPNLAFFAVRVEFNMKQGAPVVQANPMFNYFMFKLAADQPPGGAKTKAKITRHVRDKLTPFLPGDAANMKAALAGWEKELKEGIPKIQDAQQRKAAETRLALFQERLKQLNAFCEVLQKAAVINFRVYTPVDDQHEIDLFRTRPAEQKLAARR